MQTLGMKKRLVLLNQLLFAVPSLPSETTRSYPSSQWNLQPFPISTACLYLIDSLQCKLERMLSLQVFPSFTPVDFPSALNVFSRSEKGKQAGVQSILKVPSSRSSFRRAKSRVQSLLQGSINSCQIAMIYISSRFFTFLAWPAGNQRDRSPRREKATKKGRR